MLQPYAVNAVIIKVWAYLVAVLSMVPWQILCNNLNFVKSDRIAFEGYTYFAILDFRGTSCFMHRLKKCDFLEEEIRCVFDNI